MTTLSRFVLTAGRDDTGWRDNFAAITANLRAAAFALAAIVHGSLACTEQEE
jgi:hypothetical protein